MAALSILCFNVLRLSFHDLLYMQIFMGVAFRVRATTQRSSWGLGKRPSTRDRDDVSAGPSL
jgi:hypothetical protein